MHSGRKGKDKNTIQKALVTVVSESGPGSDGGPVFELSFGGTPVGNSRPLFPVNYVIVCCGAPQRVGLASEAASWLQQTL